jgi:hypothetical protein
LNPTRLSLHTLKAVLLPVKPLMPLALFMRCMKPCMLLLMVLKCGVVAPAKGVLAAIGITSPGLMMSVLPHVLLCKRMAVSHPLGCSSSMRPS